MQTAKLKFSNPNIRKEKSGRPEEYYHIVENLDEYLERILSHHKLEVINVQRLGGQSSINFLVETPHDKLILKIDLWVGVLETANRFFNLINKHLPSAPVPHVFFFDTSKNVIPHEYILINYIEHAKPEKVDGFDNFNAGIQLGELLKQIHQIKVEGFGIPINKTEWKYKTWKESVFDSLNSRYVTSLSEVFPDKTIEKVRELAEEIKEVEPVLLHADVSIENTLYDINEGQVKLVALIDPNTMGGDARWDISLCLRDEDEFNKGILTGYYSADYRNSIDDETNILLLINLLWIMGWQHLYTNHINEENKLKFETLLKKYT